MEYWQPRLHTVLLLDWKVGYEWQIGNNSDVGLSLASLLFSNWDAHLTVSDNQLTSPDYQPAWVRCPWPGTKGSSLSKALFINWPEAWGSSLIGSRTSIVPVGFALEMGLPRGLQVQSRHSSISQWDFQGPRSLWKATEASSWSSLIWEWFSKCR